PATAADRPTVRSVSSICASRGTRAPFASARRGDHAPARALTAVRRAADTGIRHALELGAGARRRLPDAAGRVALTFDDGPHPVFTPQVLDVLRDLQATATFFLVG